MPSLLPSRSRPPLPGLTDLARHGIALSFTLTLGCAHTQPRTENPAVVEEPKWIDDSLADITVDRERQRLKQLCDEGHAPTSLAQLDRLLDLFDAARFGELDASRDALWAALGETSMSRGPDGTATALTRLLEQAWSIEDRFDFVEGNQKFLADYIMLVSVDLHQPQDTEALQIRVAAYRSLAQTGHPRVRDNATWRLLDHVRGTLDAATLAVPDRRRDILAHMLYVEHDDITAYLVANGDGYREPLPPAAELVATLEKYRQQLVQIPRWSGIVARRQSQDSSLMETALAVLPAPRSSEWTLVEVPAGTGKTDPLAPVVWATPERALVEPNTPSERPASYDGDSLAPLLRAQMTRDGRGRVLLAAASELPAPSLRAVLDAADKALASTVDLAVRERAPTPQASARITVLPLQLYRPDDTLAIRPFIDARLHVHLDGHGPSVWADSKLVSRSAEGASPFIDALDRARSAYPHERSITLSLGEDVAPTQLVELAATLIGSSEPRFHALAWLPAAPLPPRVPQLADKTIANRLSALAASTSVQLEQPYPLREVDQVSVEQFIDRAKGCTAELEQANAVKHCRVDLTFDRGVLDGVRVDAKRLAAAPRLAMQSCILDQGATLRLREHRDRFTITVRFAPPR